MINSMEKDMNCYFHEKVTARTTCIACGKALCSECLVEIDGSAACRGECEKTVKKLKAIIYREEASSLKYRPFITTLLLLATGLYLCSLGYNSESLLNFNFTLGALLFAIGIINLISNVMSLLLVRDN